MPDIDIDFCYERRSEVIDYVIGKYGKDCVTQIVTFGTLAARGVIRDVGRVMDLPYNFCDTIAKNIPNELNITIDKALTMNPELRTMYETDDTVHTPVSYTHLNKVLIHAEDEAKQMGDEYVSVEHLFLALIKYPNKALKEIFKEDVYKRQLQE